MLKITADDEKSLIKQGTIAEFMRKRTQLVGFEYGLWKFTQFLAEFIDNSFDAIETYQWKEQKKPNSSYLFSLDQELALENLSISQKGKKDEISQELDIKAKTILKEELSKPIPNLTSDSEMDVLTIKENETNDIEIDLEVQNILNSLESLIKPVEDIIDTEPLVIVKLTEQDIESHISDLSSKRNEKMYTFEVFDNGIGIKKGHDYKSFGLYLASSKSVKITQTRGSQGFGASSAFSDAQNTTGKPITLISKTIDNIYGSVSEFYTTSKNEKKFLISPKEVDVPFLHGTYVKLSFLNIPYTRGYADLYVSESALLNSHITIIFIDPYNEEHIYPRKVSTFPLEPKYAKPHPSSINIGDLQDLLTKTENLTIASFLKESFVRISSKIARQIIDLAERDLQDKLNLIIIKDGYIERKEKRSDTIHYIGMEKRVYGRSEKPRDKLIIYEIASEELKNKYWDIILKYNDLDKNKDRLNKKIKKQNNLIEKAETQKQIKDIEKVIKNLLNDIEKIRDEKDNLRNEISKLIELAKDGLIEQKKFKNRNDFEDLINQVQISKIKPSELTNDQFNSLFLAFKSIKYMTPPTDTAIPVGDSVLENTMIKELGLKVSENLDDFDMPIEKITQIIENQLIEKKIQLKRENPSISEKNLNDVTISNDELLKLNSMILSNIDLSDSIASVEDYKQSFESVFQQVDQENIDKYNDIFEYFTETFSKDDDFIAAETRDPTSGKGLAYVVEAALAYSKMIEVPKRSRDVLSRFVNRTPKLRDSADCAITKAVQSVNWKNYKLEIYDNGLPKGPIKLLVNVSGPFVHLMFKSQSKSALADDEDLIKEIKYCLEAIGRKLRVYLNRRASLHKSEKRASLIEKYIPKFVKSVYSIASAGESRYCDKIDEKELQTLMKAAIGKKVPSITEFKIDEVEIEPVKEVIEETPKLEIKKIHDKEEKLVTKEISEKVVPKEELLKEKIEIKKELQKTEDLDNLTINELREFGKENKIGLPSKANKLELIKIIQKSLSKVKVPEKVLKKEIKIPEIKIEEEVSKPEISTKAPLRPPQPKQTQLPVITTDIIMDALSNEWQTIKHLIFKLKIRDMMDARYLQIKLKQMEREGRVLVDVKMGKKHWKLN